MPRIFLALFLTGLFLACSSPEFREETDATGTRTTYYVDPKTGEKTGLLSQYTPDGQLALEENYVDGLLEGARILYFPDGKVAVEETYAKGQITGDYRTYHENGTLRQRGTYAAGTMSDLWFRYYENGKVMEEVSFIDNQENGPFREWYESGHPKAAGNYLNGDKEHGQLHLYTEDGGLERVLNCEVGVCRTIWAPDSTGTAPAAPDMTPPRG